MGRIVYIMGKSSTGKDTVFKHLLSDKELGLKRIIPYTTRPIRKSETEGCEYHFVSEKEFEEMKSQKGVIEYRKYDTAQGTWIYFTANDEQVSKDRGNLIIIGTIESFKNTALFLGRERLVPVLIELDDGVRLERALGRERKQNNPDYIELCRRFLADAKDFSEEELYDAGINARFYNKDLKKCVAEIKDYLLKELKDDSNL